eukprot:COSAG01_NODE_1_length_100484_cov_170.446142_35_plen_99_part_00
MISEIAILTVKQGQSTAFEASFKEAVIYIKRAQGYISHELKTCIENDHRYLLHIRWQTLEDHTIGFRESDDFLKWKALLHHFYEPFPTVEHYQDFLNE